MRGVRKPSKLSLNFLQSPFENQQTSELISGRRMLHKHNQDLSGQYKVHTLDPPEVLKLQ